MKPTIVALLFLFNTISQAMICAETLTYDGILPEQVELIAESKSAKREKFLVFVFYNQTANGYKRTALIEKFRSGELQLRALVPITQVRAFVDDQCQVKFVNFLGSIKKAQYLIGEPGSLDRLDMDIISRGSTFVPEKGYDLKMRTKKGNTNGNALKGFFIKNLSGKVNFSPISMDDNIAHCKGGSLVKQL